MNVFRFGAVRSPPRRATVQSAEQSPFCTSPSQLQEVTLDPSMTATIPFAVGRSPDRTSPSRGRTMKEYEETLSHLQKENFNLKLRIYFLEERMDHISGTDDKEKLVKENIELKVKSETLRKELSDKQELVCQAAKAVQLMEEQHQAKLRQLQLDFREQQVASEKHIRELEVQLEKLLEEHEQQKFLRLNDSSSETLSEQIREQKKCIDNLLDKKHELECNLQDQTEHANHLEVELQEAHRESKHANKLYEDLKLEVRELDSKLKDMRVELEHKDNNIAELRQQIQSAEHSLCSKEEQIKSSTKEIAEHVEMLQQKTVQINEQEKVLANLQFSLDEKERQMEKLQSSLIARDAVIASLEAKYASSKISIRNTEQKLQASLQDVQRLQEEITLMRTQTKSGRQKCKESAGGDSNKWCYCVDRTSQKKFEASEERFLEIPLSELQKMKSKLETAEETEKTLYTKLEVSEKNMKAERAHIVELESHIKDLTQRLENTQLKCRHADEKISKLENSYRTACQTLQESLRRGKELKKENEQMKEADKKRQIEKQQMVAKLMETYNQAKMGHKQQNEENYLKNLVQKDQEKEAMLPCCAPVYEQGDNALAEIDMMSKFLLKMLKEKEEVIESIESKLTAVSQDVKMKSTQILKLEEEILELRNCVMVLQAPQSKELKGTTQEGSRAVSSSVSDLVTTIESKMHNMLLSEVQDKNREIERLNAELRKRTTNLQELVNKELWDKNREIEKLQDRLNVMCERKDLQIRTVNQQLTTRDVQLKSLQDKVVEFLTRAGIPPALILKELQTVVFPQNDDGTVSDSTKDTSKHFNGLSAAFMDGSPNLQCNLLATMEENKYLSQKVEELQERIRNTPERDNESRVVQNLRSDCLRLKEQGELSEKRYRDARDAISLLTRRLEELALFLSSLLQNRELLRGISIQRHRVLKQAVENSIELSRRFSISFASFQPVNECSNVLQMSSLSEILNFSSNSPSFTEFLKEKIKQANISDVNITPPDSKNCVSDLESKSVSLRNVQMNEVSADMQECKELEGSPSTSDLITFSPPATKSNDNCDEASLSSMTFYNSCHVLNEPSVECSKINNSISCLPESAKGLHGQINSEHTQTFAAKNTSSLVMPVHNNSSKGINQNLSDSEAWSEPDRNVSLERIGLQDDHGKAACGNVASVRARNSRAQESDNSSETSEDTAQEELRVPVVRTRRYEYGEIKRLQSKLCALEQMNDAMKKELNILHHLKDQFYVAKDKSTKSLLPSGGQEEKIPANKEAIKSDEKSITVSLCLLEEIKNQREKLESSLLHNDLIRKQLETVILNMPDSEVCDAHGLWEKLKETTENNDLAQNKVQQLEKELTVVKVKLEESHLRMNFLENSNKTLQATANTVSDLEKQIGNLHSAVQEKENEILEKKCLILELQNKAKEKSIENEKNQHFEDFFLEDLQKRLANSEEARQKVEKEIFLLEQQKREAEVRAIQVELEKDEIIIALGQGKTKYEQEICEAKQKQSALEEKLNELSVQLQNAETRIVDLIQELEISQAAIKKKDSELQDMNLVSETKFGELEKQLLEKERMYKTELDRKSAEIERQKSQCEQMQTKIKNLETKESTLKQELDKKLASLDENCKAEEVRLKGELNEMKQLLKEKENNFHRQLDDAAVAASSLTLERTKLVNEKLRLEQEIRRLELRLTDIERNSQEAEKQLQVANSQLEEKVTRLEKERSLLQKNAQELESYNAELEKNFAGLKERLKYYTLSMSSGHPSGVPEKSITDKMGMLSPSSLSSALDVFTGDGGSLPANLWSLPTNFFENIKDRPSATGVHQILSRQYSDLSDCMSEELTSDEYKVMVRRASRQFSVPCEQQLLDPSHHSVDSLDTRNTASSPDLGIESDQGRFSSLEASSLQTPLIQLETSQYMENRGGKLENVSALVLTTKGECGDLMLLKEENAELKRRLVQTRKALEKTVEQLVTANQRKKQVEKAICKQLHKTHTILKQSRVNLQNDVTADSCTDDC